MIRDWHFHARAACLCFVVLQGGSQVFGQDVIALLEGRAEIGLVAVAGDFRGLGDAYSIPLRPVVVELSGLRPSFVVGQRRGFER